MERQQGRENKKDNDLFCTCSLIDYIARKTKNKRVVVVDALIEVYRSFISDKIDDYNSSVYYENPSYIFESFIQNKML